jgi:hypothetical protein
MIGDLSNYGSLFQLAIPVGIGLLRLWSVNSSSLQQRYTVILLGPCSNAETCRVYVRTSQW